MCITYAHATKKTQQEWFSSSDPCVLSAPFIFNLHSCFKKSTGACSISAFGFFLCPPTAICYLLLSTIMPFFTPLCGFAWLLLPLGTSCLPLRAYLIYLIFLKNSHLKTHVFFCIYDAKLFCPSLLWAMKNACFNLPNMLCCSFFLSVIYATYCALPCIIQHKVARWVSATRALQ